MTEKFKILVTRKWPKKVEEKLLTTFDATLNVEDRPLSEAELVEGMRSYDALLPTVTDPITDKIISTSNKKVKIIGNFGVGFNNIDIDSAKRNSIVVTNTPEVLTDCTADIAMLLMLGVARRGSEGEFHVRKKEWTGWRPTHMMGTKVTGKTLGLIGMGRIAQAMAHKSHFGFNMKIILIMGLPGSGKTTLANELGPMLNAKRLNADEVRKQANDWDFSEEGRKRQAKRMADFALKLRKDNNYVVADFICPTPEARSLFPSDYVIWVDTIKEGRFDDTNKMFVKPDKYNFHVTTQDAKNWAPKIYKDIVQ